MIMKFDEFSILPGWFVTFLRGSPLPRLSLMYIFVQMAFRVIK